MTDLMDMKKDGSDFASEMADDFAEKMQKSFSLSVWKTLSMET